MLQNEARISATNPLPVASPCPNGTVTGNTTVGYVAALTLTNVKGAILNISNLSPSATMHYKVTGWRSSDTSCVAETIKAETSIAAATLVQDLDCVSPFAIVIVYVKWNSGTGAYQIDHIEW
jgi:hypothetical protein